MAKKDKKEKKKGALIMILGGLVFLLAGTALLLYSLSSVWTGYQSKSWPTAKGQILVRELRRSGDSALDKLPHIEYRYVVDGKSYQSQRIRFGGYSPDQGEGEEVLEKFSSDEVTVCYSSTDHSQAVLEPGPQWGTNFFFILGSLVMMLFSGLPFGFAYLELR